MTLRLPPEEYEVLRKAVLDRDGWKCRHCGSRNALHVHHIQYRSQQGEDVSWNLLTLCNQCHDAMHRMDLRIGWDDLSPIADGELYFFRANGWRPK